jgi:pimeloyl-ACP methyl ester carboxylesterase
MSYGIKYEIKKTMNSSTAELKQTKHIDGPAGLLYVTDQGTGDLPVVFLHSFGGSTSHWANQLSHVAENNRAIAFDFRGHGKSAPPVENNYAAEDLAADLASVMNALDLNKVILVGHSMGGATAVAYAKAHPEKVAGMILAGTPGKSSPEQSAPIIASLESNKYQQVMDQYMKQLLAEAKPEVNEVVMKDIEKISKATSIAIVKAMFQFDPLPTLKIFKSPLLIISTANENRQPTSLHNQLPEILNKTIEGTSHWTQLDKPEEFNLILDEFLEKF